ncbi:hypothetical protein DPMN_179769 [Dreissena polymorpha]|uniref:Uncharacterized protein n=1 Tax=Dreissena polymorpha TaxID=45954 RepID=A0A9D4ECY9_DREPO|nr:hypothetical protein DPMN_179769 [Dreissena polymorpha]
MVMVSVVDKDRRNNTFLSNLDHIMEQQSSTMLSPSDVIKKGSSFYASLSERDKALFDFAKFEVAKQMLDATELCIQFVDRGPFECLPSGCTKSAIESQMFVAYDATGRPKMKLFHYSLIRRIPGNIIKVFEFVGELIN